MPEKIISVQNQKIKNVLLLQAKSRERRKQNCFVIEGYREISRALQSGFTIKEMYYCPEFDLAKRMNGISLSYPEIMVYIVSATVFEKLAYREGSDGLIALAEPVNRTIEDLKLGKNPLIIVLESVEKPGNLGAVMRTADAAGADAVVICDPLTDLFNPNTIRSSVGCIFTRQVAVATTEEVMAWLKKHGITSFAAALTENAESYHLKDFTGPTAFIMGTEATGLSSNWLTAGTSQIIIPMKGIADSLNVSVSTAILVFEAMRQRGFHN
jgi:TrmH family RNA methyltransferase